MVIDFEIPPFRGSNGGHLRILGVIVIYIRLGYITVRCYFAVAESLLVPLILGEKFIEKYLRSITLPEQRIVPWDSQSVAILSNSTESPSVGSIDLDDIPRRVLTDKFDNSVFDVRQYTPDPWT